MGLQALSLPHTVEEGQREFRKPRQKLASYQRDLKPETAVLEPHTDKKASQARAKAKREADQDSKFNDGYGHSCIKVWQDKQGVQGQTNQHQVIRQVKLDKAREKTCFA